MSSVTIGERQKKRPSSSCSSFDSKPHYRAHPPRHLQHLEADKAPQFMPNSPTDSSPPTSPKCAVPRTHTMSPANSTMPSSKLPFSNSVTGTGAVLIGPLASFDSETQRGMLATAAECCSESCSSGLSRAAVLLSNQGVASPLVTPRQPPSILAAFCPLTSEAWQSGTMRDGIAVDANTMSTCSRTDSRTGLQSSLFFSPGWPQSSRLAAAQSALTSLMGTPGQFSTNTAAEGDETEATARKTAAFSANRSVSRMSSPVDFMPVYPMRPPEPFAMDFSSPLVPEVSFLTSPNVWAPRAETAKGFGATPAPSSCLPSEPLEQQSLLRSPLLYSLIPPSIPPSASLSSGFGCIGESKQTQNRLSRHRSAASAEPDDLLSRLGNKIRVRGAANASPLPAALPSVKSKRKKRDHLFTSPTRRSFRSPLINSNEASLSSFFVAQDAEAHRTIAVGKVSDEEDAAHRTTSANAHRSGLPEDVEGEEDVTATAAATTTDDTFEDLWGILPAARRGGGATETPSHITTSSALFETAPAFRCVTAFASETHETDDQLSEELNQPSRFSCAVIEKQRNVMVHQSSAGQQRNSVNTFTNPQRTVSKGLTPQQLQRHFSLPQDDAIEVKRRSCP
ncbi:hypothetical protein Q4I30_003070 [Leishmania utingensis]|uniref:Uncharacterized protein n=1 Tax=Leishmania utingensis TaxID=653362 RepID=A0AAW3ANF6_9TRYP